MKRFLVGCALALAVLAASEQRASAGSCGFNIGLDFGFRFSYWNQNCCNNGPPGYGPGGWVNYAPPAYPQYGYAQAPMAAPAAPATAPAAAPATPTKPATPAALQVGYGYYPGVVSYDYSQVYWYGY
jgi:hypothetical protein